MSDEDIILHFKQKAILKVLNTVFLEELIFFLLVKKSVFLCYNKIQLKSFRKIC